VRLVFQAVGMNLIRSSATAHRSRRMSAVAAAMLGLVGLTACAGLADGKAVADTASATTESGARTWAVECTPGHLVQTPRTFTLACADANESLGSLTWQNWGEPTATASGKLVVNTCRPTCVAGKFVSYPVDVTMSRRVVATKPATSSSGDKKVWLYTVVTFQATGDHPKGTPDHGRFRLPATV
jgi:hypothetical protein